MNEESLKVNGRLIVKGTAEAKAMARIDLDIQDPDQEEIDKLIATIKEDKDDDVTGQTTTTSDTDNNEDS